jgi:chorismate dehydratase
VKQGPLRIGKINYTNLFPVFSMLEKGADCSAYEFTEGVPSVVNRLLREGKIDVSPSSSIEYLRRKTLYTLLEGHSISSFGPIRSILLFSTTPIEALNGLTVLASSQSETSVALLDITLRKFYGFDCPLKSSQEPLSEAMKSYSAYLLIGDDAMREARMQPGLHTYDLGDIWYKKTGLPFVFALWIARNDCCMNAPLLLERFRKDLDKAKDRALKNLKAIARESPIIPVLSEEELVSYWRGISYDLNDEHKKGLVLFRKYAAELKLI